MRNHFHKNRETVDGIGFCQIFDVEKIFRIQNIIYIKISTKMNMISYLLALCPVLCSAFRSQPLFSKVKMDSKSMKLSAISDRRAMFLNIVETGLLDRYQENDIKRIKKMLDFIRGSATMPTKDQLLPMHDPCEEYIENLTARPWWDKNNFAWVKDLESKSNEIAEELQFVETSSVVFKSDSKYAQTMGEGWTAFRLQRFGEWNADNCALFPKTTQILRSLAIPLAMRGVMFAKQKPNSGVQPHSDGRNFILTGHLGLKVPKAHELCWIKVGGEKRSWMKNELLVFDTSFTHETMNSSDEDRYVLILDFWHPELTQIERDSLSFVYDARNKFDSGRERDIESSYFDTVDVVASSPNIFQSIANLFGSK